MVRVEIEKLIPQPIDKVFERLADIQGYNDWMPGGGLFIACSKDSSGPVGKGTIYSDRTRLGTVRGEVFEFDRPTRLTFHYTARLLGVKVMEGWPGYKLKKLNDSSTYVYHHARGKLFNGFQLFRPLVQRIAQSERQRTVDALNQSLQPQAS